MIINEESLTTEDAKIKPFTTEFVTRNLITFSKILHCLSQLDATSVREEDLDHYIISVFEIWTFLMHRLSKKVDQTQNIMAFMIYLRQTTFSSEQVNHKTLILFWFMLCEIIFRLFLPWLSFVQYYQISC
jgi:hypothetical protein